MQDPNRLTGMAGMANANVSERTHGSNWEQNWKCQVEPATAKHDWFPCIYAYQSYIIEGMCHNNLSISCAETHSSSSLWVMQLPSSDLLQWHHSCEADVLPWYLSLDLAPLTSAGLRFCSWATDVGAPGQNRSNLHQAGAGNSSIRLITSANLSLSVLRMKRSRPLESDCDLSNKALDMRSFHILYDGPT